MCACSTIAVVLSLMAWSSAAARAPGDAAPVGEASFGWRVTALPPAAGAGSFGEPGIVSGPGGALMVSASSANDNVPPTWWLSGDAGGTWGPARDLDRTGSWTGDADSLVAGDGYHYALNLAYNNPPSQPVNPTALVFRSPDGVAWSGPATIPPPQGVDQPDRPWLAADPRHPQRLLLVNSEGAGDFVAWTSTDHGASFAGPVTITAGGHPSAALALSSRPMFDPTGDGRVFMLYETGSLTNDAGLAGVAAGAPDFPLTQLWLAESDDGGLHWNDTEVLDATAAFGQAAAGGSLAHTLVAAAIDRAGTLYASFSLRLTSSPQTHIFLVRSADHGHSWSSPTRVDAGGLGSNVMPWLAAGDAGKVDLTWYGSTTPDFTDPVSTWAEMFAQSVDAGSAHPTFTQSRVSGNRPVHTGDINAAGNLGSRFHNWSLRDFQSVAVDGCGRAHPAWSDDLAGDRTFVAAQTMGGSLGGDDCPSAAESPPVTPRSAAVSASLPNTARGAPWLDAITVAGVLLVLRSAGPRRRMRAGDRR